MKNILKNKKLLLSAAVLLVVIVIAVIVIRRRGRKADDGTPLSGNVSLTNNILSFTGKKVYVRDRNAVNVLWYDDFTHYYYFDKTLEYVIVPNSASEQIDEDGKVFTEVVAVGYVIGGRLTRKVLSKPAYIAKSYLNI